MRLTFLHLSLFGFLLKVIHLTRLLVVDTGLDVLDVVLQPGVVVLSPLCSQNFVSYRDGSIHFDLFII